MKNIIKTTILIGVLTVSIFSSCDSDKSTEGSNNTEVKENNNTAIFCPHCDGLGRRTNNITGEFTDCSSCGGDGRVTQEQYNRLSK